MPGGAMARLSFALLALHVFSVLFWVGSLVSVTRVMTSAAGEAEAVRARLAAVARKIYRSVSSPWMGIALLTGVGMIALQRGAHFQIGLFHGKLTAVLVMLALHFTLGSKVRAAEANGLTDEAAGSARALQIGVLVAAALAVGSIIAMKHWQ